MLYTVRKNCTRRIRCLLGVLLLVVFLLGTVACNAQKQNDPTKSDTTAEKTDVEQSAGNSESTGGEEETTAEPTLSAHDRLMTQLAYTDEEKEALRETAEKMSGLRVSYYADGDATKLISTETVTSATVTVDKDSGIRAVSMEGYITFEKDGKYSLSFKYNKRQGTVAIGQGEHHVTTSKNVSVSAIAGAQYSIKLTASWSKLSDDLQLRFTANDSEEGFAFSVGRVLLEHEPVSVSPVCDIPLRDTYICNGPDNLYYMIGTTGPDFWNSNYVIHVYRSADLSEWTDLGVVWDFRTDATWAKEVSKDTRVPVWAPELHYIGGNWYITYSLGFNDGFCGGILVSTSGKPEGPYTDTSEKKLVDNIDGSLFVDDDGTVYYIYDEGLIAPMNESLSDFTAEFTPLLAADGLPVGFEGCSIFKHNGKYYLTAATYNESYDQNGELVRTYDSMIAVSDNLFGPYSDTRLLLRDGGHNNLFIGTDGNIYTTLFGPSGTWGFSCRPAIVRLYEDHRGILSVDSLDTVATN